MLLANPLVDLVRSLDRIGCKSCSRGGVMTAIHDQTGVYIVHDQWLFRDTKVRVDYSCGCHATLMEPRKWNLQHPEYESMRPK